jgi:hypothetical protein
MAVTRAKRKIMWVCWRLCRCVEDYVGVLETIQLVLIRYFVESKQVPNMATMINIFSFRFDGAYYPLYVGVWILHGVR